MKRTTVYFEENIHRALKLKAVEVDQSISDFVNDAVKTALEEDLEDFSSIEARKMQKTVSYEEFLNALKHSGQL